MERTSKRTPRAEPSASPLLSLTTLTVSLLSVFSEQPHSAPSQPLFRLPIPSMLASTRVSTAQRPTTAARAFTAVATTSKPRSVAAPRSATGAAPARRSAKLICRAEPGEGTVLFLDSFWIARARRHFVSVEAGNSIGTTRTKRTEENNNDGKRADRNHRSPSKPKKNQPPLELQRRRRRPWPRPPPPPPPPRLLPRPAGSPSSGPRTCRKGRAGKSASTGGPCCSSGTGTR